MVRNKIRNLCDARKFFDVIQSYHAYQTTAIATIKAATGRFWRTHRDLELDPVSRMIR